MFQLPQVLQRFIYEFDSTYRKQFDRCLIEIGKMNPTAKEFSTLEITEDQIVDCDIVELVDIDCDDFNFTIDYHIQNEHYEYSIYQKNEWKDFSNASRKLFSKTLISTFPAMSQDPDHDFSYNYNTKTEVEAYDRTLEEYYELFSKVMEGLRA